MSILSLNNANLILAGHCLLDNANLQIHERERIALVGRNGAGKSTLLKVMQGQHPLDSGELKIQSGLRIASLMQEVPVDVDDSVYHVLVKDLGETGEVLTQLHDLQGQEQGEDLAACQQRLDNLHGWHYLPTIETMASHLGIPLDERMSNLSGGLKRRVLLGAALLAEPDLLLLDEPTNHLDIEAIEWLEDYLKGMPGSVVVVTHDREFLSQIATDIVELDRGRLSAFHCNYETYLDRKEAMNMAEQKQSDLFDKRLADEEAWIRTGIKARRTRNEGRVRALKAMREEYKSRRNPVGKAKTMQVEVARSGAVVVEAKNVSYGVPDRNILNHVSLLLMRGDKLGIVGPNGCGKTTFIRLLLGELQPDSGAVKQGTNLQVAYFDQLRRQLDEDKTLLYNVADGADHVTIMGKEKHVASYLKEFLFTAERFNQPASSLSGGERNRLLLAKLFAKPANFLVFDEPTNDLDVETLELLETVLREYTGTFILISHGRAFINQVVTSVLVYEGDGTFNEYVGGYDDYKTYLAQKGEVKKPVSAEKKSSQPVGTVAKLSYNEQRELAKLPKLIEALEEKIGAIHQQMALPGFYDNPNETIESMTKQLEQEEKLLLDYFARWEVLEEKGSNP